MLASAAEAMLFLEIELANLLVEMLEMKMERFLQCLGIQKLFLVEKSLFLN